MEMARKPRLEFAGAIYHVISRGNCRKELFDEGSAKLFEKTLFEVCRKCEWFLHAYVIMNNHYYLAVETPEGNLVEGMRWLQGTFGIRFNALRDERGHVFQSRYKSLVIEGGEAAFGTRQLHSSQSSAGRSGDGREVAHLPSVKLSEILPEPTAGAAEARTFSFCLGVSRLCCGEEAI